MNKEPDASTTIASLGLGDAFTYEELTAAVQKYRNRSLKVAEVAELNDGRGLCAVVFSSENWDLVLHAHSDSRLHVQQFVLHEFAHIVLGHCDTDRHDTQDVILPDFPEGLKARVLARKDLDSHTEIAAELLADSFAAAIRRASLAESGFTEVFG